MPELPAPATIPSADEVLSGADLQRKLAQFDAYLSSEELTPSARFTYVDQAGRFLRWLAGEYRPRNSAASRTEVRRRRATWTLTELRTDLDAYAEELHAARLKPLAIQTYIGRSETFLRWLEGRYTTRGPNATLKRVPTEDDSWLAESAIQDHVMNWLRAEGWTIVRYATGREHGTDIDAERDGERLAVEVKGYPRRLHTFGSNKGQERKWHPAAQARTYIGNAVHAALTMLHSDPERSVAIAMPDVPAYRGLADRSRSPLRKLDIDLWFVDQAGGVTSG